MPDQLWRWSEIQVTNALDCHISRLRIRRIAGDVDNEESSWHRPATSELAPIARLKVLAGRDAVVSLHELVASLPGVHIVGDGIASLG